MAVAKPQTALTTSITAPIGGWNARDSVAAMPPTDAVTLTNLYPTPTDVQLRKGYSKYSIGITGQVNTVMNYAGANTQKLFAAAGTTIYNCDTPTATSATTITNDKLQYINISNSGGNFLVACNGTDLTLIYDGTNWIKMATTGTAASITSITHVGSVATLTTATVHGLVTGNEVTISGSVPSACRRLPPRKSLPDKDLDGIFQKLRGLFCRECLFLLPRLAFHAPSQLRADDEHITAATLALEADVCAQPCDLPIKTAAGVGFFKAHDVVEFEFGNHGGSCQKPRNMFISSRSLRAAEAAACAKSLPLEA